MVYASLKVSAWHRVGFFADRWLVDVTARLAVGIVDAAPSLIEEVLALGVAFSLPNTAKRIAGVAGIRYCAFAWKRIFAYVALENFESLLEGALDVQRSFLWCGGSSWSKAECSCRGSIECMRKSYRSKAEKEEDPSRDRDERASHRSSGFGVKGRRQQWGTRPENDLVETYNHASEAQI